MNYIELYLTVIKGLQTLTNEGTLTNNIKSVWKNSAIASFFECRSIEYIPFAPDVSDDFLLGSCKEALNWKTKQF